MATFWITTVVPPFKDGALVDPIKASCRESRAKRQARRLRAQGQNNVMLFKQVGQNYLPVSLKQITRHFSETGSHRPNNNSVMVGEPIEKEGIGRVAGGRLDRMIRMNKGARAAING